MAYTATAELAGTERNGDVTVTVTVRADGTWEHTYARDDGEPGPVVLSEAEEAEAMRQITAALREQGWRE